MAFKRQYPGVLGVLKVSWVFSGQRRVSTGLILRFFKGKVAVFSAGWLERARGHGNRAGVGGKAACPL